MEFYLAISNIPTKYLSVIKLQNTHNYPSYNYATLV